MGINLNDDFPIAYRPLPIAYLPITRFKELS